MSGSQGNESETSHCMFPALLEKQSKSFSDGERGVRREKGKIYLYTDGGDAFW